MRAGGPVSARGPDGGGSARFLGELAESRRAEGRLPWKQLAASALVAAVVVARYLWFA